MICPKCNKEMIDGFISTKEVLAFRANAKKVLPEDKKHSVMGVEYIKLSKMPIFTPVKAESYYCSVCDFVITPVIK